MLLITPDGTNMYFDNDYLFSLITTLSYIGQDKELHGLLLALYSEVNEYYLSIRELNNLFKALYLNSIGGIYHE